MSEFFTLRLYEHPDVRATVEHCAGEIECSARGWAHKVGDTVEIDGTAHVLTYVGDVIFTDGRNGSYVVAEAEEVK